MAIDIVGDTPWADAHCDQFALQQFTQVNHEPWHFQCAELPRSVSSWIAAGRPQPKAGAGGSPSVSTPAQPVNTPTGSQHPTLHVGDHGPAVATMQALLIKAGGMADRPTNRDGVFGPGTLGVVKKFQGAHHLQADGICGPLTWTALSG